MDDGIRRVEITYLSGLEPLGRFGTTQVGRGHSGGSGLLGLGVAPAARVHYDVLYWTVTSMLFLPINPFPSNTFFMYCFD